MTETIELRHEYTSVSSFFYAFMETLKICAKKDNVEIKNIELLTDLANMFSSGNIAPIKIPLIEKILLDPYVMAKFNSFHKPVYLKHNPLSELNIAQTCICVKRVLTSEIANCGYDYDAESTAEKNGQEILKVKINEEGFLTGIPGINKPIHRNDYAFFGSDKMKNDRLLFLHEGNLYMFFQGDNTYDGKSFSTQYLFQKYDEGRVFTSKTFNGEIISSYPLNHILIEIFREANFPRVNNLLVKWHNLTGKRIFSGEL